MENRHNQLPLKILLVEDNPDHAELIERVLKRGKIPCEIDLITCGEKCLEEVAKGKYDLALLDYNLPRMNGLDILKRINEKGRDLPVIMITGQGDEMIAVEAMKKGAYDYVTKSREHLVTLPLVILRTMERSKIAKEKKRLEEELKKLSVTDDLTGLFNKRFLYRKIQEEVIRARRQNTPLSILVFDLDNFKQYNDTKGHLEGDILLKRVGEIVKENIRDVVDSPCRYGGDEFIVILPGVSENIAPRIAERIRRSVERAGFENVTASFGFAQYRMNEDVDSLIKRADEAMYKAKKSGGNRIYPELEKE